MLNTPDMTEYLKILDDKAIVSKEQFILTCSANGLEIDEAIYQNVIRYEIDQLMKIKKLESMFRDFPEKSLWEYKKLFHLVESAGIVIDSRSFERKFEVRIIGPDSDRVFSTHLELLEDMQSMFGVDSDAEIFNLLMIEGLKR